MTLTQFLVVLRGRWRLMVVVFLAVTLAAGAAALLLPREYAATTQVVVDVKPDPIAGVVMPGMLSPGYVATQVDILTSERLALMVVDRLKITESAEAVEFFQEETSGAGSIRQFFSELLRKRLEVKPSRQSTVLSITFSGNDPEFSAAVANAFAQAYIDTNIEMRVEPATQQSKWFDEQTSQLRERLDTAQRALTAYQRTNGIVSTDERLDVETAKLGELSSQLTVLSAMVVDAAKRHRLAQSLLEKGTAGELPDVLQNPLVQQLKADQARLEARQKEQMAVLGRNHPDIRRINDELVNVRGRTVQEVRTVAGSLGRAHSVAAQREAELKAALSSQRASVLQIKRGRDQLMVLQRDVENAQRAFEGIAQRLTQTSLESKTTQANLFVLTRALPPNGPTSPRVNLIAAVGVFLGLLLAVGAALLAESMRRRIRSADDLTQAIGAPVVGRIRRVPRRLLVNAHGWKPGPLGPASTTAETGGLV
ncbi:MAG TPA: chain length determinant protein EpsF [Lautropia sp.]|nr:chain length determinant protein EpsF [Lautropia sp.]